jgi:SAM-dependent methyltransferase
MPAAMGVSYWPREGPNVSALVEIDNLPLPDNSIDRVIALHALEGLAEPNPLLREVWRVMKSGGRFLTIVPNRRGLWAHSDRTPFGYGQPFSLFQIKDALHHQGFLIERVRYALYAPPGASRLGLSLADKIEKYAGWLFPGLGGLLLVEASKQLYAPLAPKTSLRHRLVLPLPLPSSPPVPAG